MADGQTQVNLSEVIPLCDYTTATTIMRSLFRGRDSPLLQASVSFK